VPTYTLQIRRHGKFRPVSTGLTKGEALAKGSDITLNNLARTFRIAQTGQSKEIFGIEDFMPSEFQFRGYKIRKGKKIETSNQFIQLNSANLQTQAEKFQIQEARRMKNLIGY
jgi:ribosome-associated protein YbcJ (S4-like RNA binding protein)